LAVQHPQAIFQQGNFYISQRPVVGYFNKVMMDQSMGDMKTSHILEKRWQRGLQTKTQFRRMWHVNMLVQKDDAKQYILQRE
jgi:hypothetical protein